MLFRSSPSFTLRLQPAPETEGDMMIEVFKYTERVVNMIRPRKLLFMAIGGSTFYPRLEFVDILLDGVAPRAKMNQQRSRRFRTAQEAQEKEVAHKESVAIWECVPIAPLSPNCSQY